MDPRQRSDRCPGMTVNIVLKKDQKSDRLICGIVQDVLTCAPFHSRGINVRLSDGQVGRVKGPAENGRPY